MASILVVEDDPDIGETLTELLSSEGHSVSLARDGHEGLLAAAGLPDLVILDLTLPHLSGSEVARTMFVHNAGLEQIPIILASARPDLASVAQIVGTPYFIGKPFSFAALSELVDRALSERIPPAPGVGPTADGP